jgi:hypothetical protein
VNVKKILEVSIVQIQLDFSPIHRKIILIKKWKRSGQQTFKNVFIFWGKCTKGNRRPKLYLHVGWKKCGRRSFLCRFMQPQGKSKKFLEEIILFVENILAHTYYVHVVILSM